MADPYRVGVGIGRKSPLDHPKRLVGVPHAATGGGVFPARQETISRAPVRRCCVESKRSKFGNHDDAGARDLPELRINLKEIHVDSSVAVAEAAAALTAQGVQAIWVGGDNTVLLALDSVIAAARKARIPVFLLSQ